MLGRLPEATALESVKLPLILSGVCSLSSANYFPNPFGIFEIYLTLSNFEGDIFAQKYLNKLIQQDIYEVWEIFQRKKYVYCSSTYYFKRIFFNAITFFLTTQIAIGGYKNWTIRSNNTKKMNILFFLSSTWMWI